MKHSYKIISLLLSGLILSSSFISCSEAKSNETERETDPAIPDETSDTATETDETESAVMWDYVPDDLPTEDFKGYV